MTITEEVLQKKEEEEMERKRDEIVDGLDIDENNTLTPEQTEQLHQLLRRHKDFFATSDMDIGLYQDVKHIIDLAGDTPLKQRHRRIPPNMVKEVRKHLDQLLARGIIEPSKSPWASPVVLVHKKNGKL